MAVAAPWFQIRADEAPRTAPQSAPKPVRLPVFVNDCATPLAGTTLLALLLQNQGGTDHGPWPPRGAPDVTQP